MKIGEIEANSQRICITSWIDMVFLQHYLCPKTQWGMVILVIYIDGFFIGKNKVMLSF